MKWISEQVHRYASHHYLLGMRYLLCSWLASFGSATLRQSNRGWQMTGIDVYAGALFNFGVSSPRVDF